MASEKITILTPMPRYIAILFALPLLLCSCSGEKCGTYNPDTHFCDERDGTTYKYVKIGDMLWMAENLNYKAKGSMNSWCNNNEPSNCEKYGRLYDWETATHVCPNGWRLSSAYEWRSLMDLTKIEGKNKYLKLKSETDWNNFKDGTSGSGTDSLGFSALPGGCRDYRGKFVPVGYCGNWWATGNAHDWWVIEDTTLSNAYRICVNYSEECSKYNNNKDSVGYSIRCVKRDYASDAAFAMQIEEKSKTLFNFNDYRDYLDSLFKDKYGAMHKWCNIMKNAPEMKSHYLGIISQRDDFLTYYDERCIKAVKYFEQLTTSVEYKYSYGSGGGLGGKPLTVNIVSLAKADTGAFAKYSFYSANELIKHFETKLSTEEWHGLLKVLYKLTNELKPSDDINPLWWTLSINSSNKETYLFKGYRGEHPLDIKVLEKVMDDIEKKIKASVDEARR